MVAFNQTNSIDNETTANQNEEEIAMLTLHDPAADRSANATIDEDAAQEPTATKKPRTTRGVVTFFAATALTGAILTGLGLAPRAGQARELATSAQATTEARRLVSVVSPTRDGSTYEL